MIKFERLDREPFPREVCLLERLNLEIICGHKVLNNWSISGRNRDRFKNSIKRMIIGTRFKRMHPETYADMVVLQPFDTRNVKND